MCCQRLPCRLGETPAALLRGGAGLGVAAGNAWLLSFQGRGEKKKYDLGPLVFPALDLRGP